MRGRTPITRQATLNGKTLPFNVACFSLFGCFPSSGPGCARSTFPVGEGDLPAGAFPYLPLGEGAAAAAEEGRYQVGSASRPTPVTPTACHPLPGEGRGSSPGPGL